MISTQPNPSSDLRPRHWLLWDGECGFCRESVEWVRRRDCAGAFRAMPFQDAPSPPMTPELRERCRQSVHVVTADQRVLASGAACAFVITQIGYRRLGRMMSWPLIRSLVEWGYRRVANNRNWLGRLIFGKQCST